MEFWVPAAVGACIGGLCLLPLLVVLEVWLRKQARARVPQILDRLDPELRQQTGLRHIPPKSFLMSYGRCDFAGEYRGRRLHLTAIRTVDLGTELSGAKEVVGTSLAVQARNSAHFALCIGEPNFLFWLLHRVFKSRNVSSGDKDFDLTFNPRGRPAELVQRATRLVLETTPKWGGDRIALGRQELSCHWSVAVEDARVDMAVVNLLCDLADLAEEMASDTAGTGRPGGE